MCRIEGCEKEVKFKSEQLCQMHYFRRMRTGSFDKRCKKKRLINHAGYHLVLAQDHILSDSKGYVFEHRYVYFSQISTEVSKCEICGTPITWADCHIDHIDEDVANNNASNLRALCRPCNVYRGHTAKSMGKQFLTVDGLTLSASAWARQKGVEVSCASIRRRKKEGMSDYDAIYAPRKTHQSTKTKVRECRYDEVRGIPTSASISRVDVD